MSAQLVNVSCRVWKKVRHWEEEPPDDVGDADMVGGGLSKPFSFRDVVLNSSSENVNINDEWEMEDFDLWKDDVGKDVVDGVPSIEFSDRVYGLIDDSMSKTLIVKLLGRKIGYIALWNKMCVMWKPYMRFQLMDIDNGYYLAKFES